jgi:enterochelin esterase-like enzyme
MESLSRKSIGCLAVCVALFASINGQLLFPATGQSVDRRQGTQEASETAKRGTVERIKVHGKSLEGNLDGDSPDRDVSIYLPASYKNEKNRRYPVVYMLHGFTDDEVRWFGAVRHWINLPEVLNKTFAGGNAREMIVVMPNAFTRFKGSMYSNSVTVGDWETFVTQELVAYIDSHYRTLPQAASRGLAGHSMGGYGTMRLGMKSQGVFSSIYALSPCCMDTGRRNPPDETMKEMLKKLEGIKTDEEVKAQSFFGLAVLASAAAWSPNPTNPPFYLDLPFREGELLPEIQAKQQANATLVMIHQYIPSLKRLKAIGFDAGTKDLGIHAASKELDRVLTDYGIEHSYESYDGDHLNRIAERIQTKAMPFFSTNLSFELTKR